MSNTQTRPATGRGTIWHLPTRTRRALILAPPLVLAGFTVLHPNPDHNVQALMDASTWFMGFHMIQLALVGLVGVSVFLLADRFGRASAWPTCIGMGIFLVFFSAYDTLAGHRHRTRDARHTRAPGVAARRGVRACRVVAGGRAVGLLAQHCRDRRLGPRAGVPGLHNEGRGSPRSQWVFLGLAAFFLLLGHPAPFGTLAFGSLFVAALMHEVHSRRVPERALPDTSQAALPK